VEIHRLSPLLENLFMLLKSPRAIAAPLLIATVSMLFSSCGGEGGHSGGHAEKPSGNGGHGSGGKKSTGSHGSGASKGHASRVAPSDAAELLDLLEVGGRQDPSRFIEVEIGTFRITHKLADEGHAVLVKFRLFGIVSETKEERLHEELPKFEKRIRDAIISLVQKTEADQLSEPGLKWLKAELVAAINRVVQDRAVADVAFSDFSLEEV
jgi:hypothetical protein